MFESGNESPREAALHDRHSSTIVRAHGTEARDKQHINGVGKTKIIEC